MFLAYLSQILIRPMKRSVSMLLLWYGEPILLVHCFYKMSPLNHKRTTSSLVPPIFYVMKNLAKKKIEGSPWS